jgi:tRNA(Ile)-lysidine synthase
MKLTEETLEQKVRSFLRGLTIESPKILIALSGGPDSLALLNLLYGILGKENLGCAYYNHGIRSTSALDSEERIVKETCKALGVSLAKGKAEPGELIALAESTGRSLEEVAREYRYRFLQSVREEGKWEYIATGHHHDDQIETLIMRFFQGSGPEGLKGILNQQGNVIRPLLNCRRNEIIRYLESRRIRWNEDKSNRDTNFLRNAVRAKIIPLIKELFPGFGRSLSLFSGKMGLVTDFIDEVLEKTLIWEELTEEPGNMEGKGFSISSREFWAAHPLLRVESLYCIMNRCGIKRVRYSFFQPVIKSSFKTVGKKVYLSGYGYTLKQRGEHLFWTRDVVVSRKKGYLMIVQPGARGRIGDYGVSFFTLPYSPAAAECSTVVKYAEGDAPLVIRSKKAGDTIRLKDGSKSVKKIFQEWGVTDEDRNLIPVIEDRRGVRGILGGVFGYQDRFSYEPQPGKSRINIVFTELF